ncbi:hypothetical protein SDC9_94270 [bioreactor metagenome]|uniref:MlaB-like STAS domain-containing protein n=1 Tax=bioreactor metagenome TaxID=1076179 RepID=A0A645A2Z4_9ZZZZ
MVMSKEESARGLLSKVVRFVRNPTVQWAELDAPEEDKDGQYSKQMLKEMIERKRRNDFVRRREFDQLRKIRRKELVQGQKLEDAAGRTSFAQSTLLSQTNTNASPDGRAVTLKKIDEIEAQMSQQWWRANPGGVAAGDRPVVPRVIPPPLLQDPLVTAEVPLEFAVTTPLTVSATSFAPTRPATAEELGMPNLALNAGAAMLDIPTLAMEDAIVAHEELEKFVREPDLEEAAIRFANGDYAGAESGLLEVLARHAKDDPREQAEIWMTLFDLYRATGQQERFDKLAIDYAGRFSRSAPLWFSLPEQLGLESGGATGSANQREFNWSAPATLTTQSLAALQATLARKPAPPWTLNWSRTIDVEPQALPALGDLFLRWVEEPVDIRFAGVSALNAMLAAKTPSGDRSADPQWWRLRMAALRLMGLPDDFELVALDYCVTYEVSPPSWAPTKHKFQGDDSALNAAIEQARADAQGERDVSPTTRMPPADAAKPSGLSGYIDGDAVPLLEPFEALARPGVPLQIPCDRLIRMDFPAAGSVLNWAAEQQAQGRAVQFTNLHRLIAVFFNVIGVGEHAWVVPRRN